VELLGSVYHWGLELNAITVVGTCGGACFALCLVSCLSVPIRRFSGTAVSRLSPKASLDIFGTGRGRASPSSRPLLALSLSTAFLAPPICRDGEGRPELYVGIHVPPNFSLSLEPLDCTVVGTGARY